MRREAAKGDSEGRRVKGLPITSCVLSRGQTPIPHWQVFRWFFMNSSLVQRMLFLPRSVPVPHPFFNQFIINITESANFHSLLEEKGEKGRKNISRTLLDLVSYRIPVSVEFCMSSSAVPSCFSTHPPQWVSLPFCYPQLTDRHWWDAWTTPLQTASKSRLAIGLRNLVLIPTATPRHRSKPWSPNASSTAGRAMFSPAPQRVHGGKSSCFTAAG